MSKKRPPKKKAKRAAPPAKNAVPHLEPSPELDALLRRVVQGILSLDLVDCAGLFLAVPSDPEMLVPTWGTDEKGKISREYNAKYAFKLKPRTPLALAMGHKSGIFLTSDPRARMKLSPIYRKEYANSLGGHGTIALRSGKNLLGAIFVDNRLSNRTVDRQVLKILSPFADLAANAIKNAGLYLEVSRQNEALQTLSGLAPKLMVSPDLDRTLDLLVRSAEKVARSEAATIFLRDPKTGGLTVEKATGPQGEKIKGLKLKPGEGVVGWVVKTGKPAVVKDTARDKRFTQRVDKKVKFQTRSLLAVPMVTGGKMVGVLEAINRKGTEKYGSQDVLMLEALAQQAAAAIETARLSEELKERNTLFDLIMDYAFDGINICMTNDPDKAAWRKLVVCNNRFVEMSGYSREELMACPDLNKLTESHESQDLRVMKKGKTKLEGVLKGVGSWKRPDKKENYYEWISSGGFRFRGQFYTIGCDRDITERRQAEEDIKRNSLYDSLTGLPNRAHFVDKLDRAIKKAKSQDIKLAVLIVDLDRFKYMKDSLGYSVVDGLVHSVAERLRAHLRGSVMLSRFSEGEFGLFVPQFSAAVDAARLAKVILESFRKEGLQIQGHDVRPTVSIGISVYPNDGTDAEKLIRNAGSSVSEVKKRGRDNYQFYASAMNASAFQHLAMEGQLRRAIEGNQLEAYFQPQIDVKTGNVVAAEALVRWNHPDLGVVSPAEFIPLAEETGLILELGSWMMRTSCRQAAAWRKVLKRPFRVCVNLSAHQFEQEDLLDEIQAALSEAKLDAPSLEVEITESTAMVDPQKTIRTLKRLRGLGVRSALDDFGTGYSSLSYLKLYPIQALKIDRSFVRDLVHDSDADAIAAAIITLAHIMKLEVVAEGVESKDQFDFLKKRDCDIIQGFYFSRPVPAPKFGKDILRL